MYARSVEPAAAGAPLVVITGHDTRQLRALGLGATVPVAVEPLLSAIDGGAA